MVAAGERKDVGGAVPADATVDGWADTLNQNIQRLMLLSRRLGTNARILYVDSNRGRTWSPLQASDDPTNIVRIPGPGVTVDENGMRMSAVGFGDFSTIGEAIGYALDAALRGEAPPSSSEPYLIVIRPGTYVEDLVLAPNVHLLGETSAPAVQLYPVTGGHVYVAAGASDRLVLQNLTLANSANATAALFECNGGDITFNACYLNQQGADANQGGCIRVNPGFDFTVELKNCRMQMVHADALPIVDLGSATGSFLLSDDTQVIGTSGIRAIFDPAGPLGTASAVTVVVANSLLQATHDAGFAFQGYPSSFELLNSLCEGPVSLDTMTYGVGTFTHNLDVTISGAHINVSSTAGASACLTFDSRGTTGFCSLALGEVASPPNGVHPFLLFPGAPGSVPTLATTGQSRSSYFDNNYTRPEDPGSGSLNPGSQLPTSNVQEALSLLTAYTLPDTLAPFHSLDSAYDGLATLLPVVRGAGLGRAIVADAGAVQVTRGLTAPLISEPLLPGGYQVEGQLDVGPIQTDGWGSEFTVSPNLFGMGPMVKLGRQVRPNVTGLRGLVHSLTGFDEVAPYDYTLHTGNGVSAAVGHRGDIALVAGSGVGVAPPGGGHVLLQAGDMSAVGASSAGSLWLCPGDHPVTGGKVNVVAPAAALPATLVAANAYVGGVDGYLYLQTVSGITRIELQVADVLATLVNRINASSLMLVASVSGGTKLQLTSLNRGSSAFILYMGDESLLAPGAINTAVGDLIPPPLGTAVYTGGSFPTYVSLDCPAADQLHVSGVLSSNGVKYQGPVTTPGAAVAVDTLIVGVDNSGGSVTITLPVTPGTGRQVIIKHETGTLSVATPLIVNPGANTIEGAAGTVTYDDPLDDRISLSYYWNGSGWYIY